MRDGGALALLICPGYRANHRTLSPHACILQVWVFPPGDLASRRRRSYIWPSPPRAASRRSHFSARPPRKGPRRPRCGRAQARPTTPDTTAAAACGPAPPHRFQLAIQLSASLKQTSKAQALRMYGLFMVATEGDCPHGSPPEDERARAKWEAWAALRGVPRQSAQDEYCELVESLAERGAYPPARADALTRPLPGPPARGRHEGKPLLLTEGDSDQSGPCPGLKTVRCGCSVM